MTDTDFTGELSIEPIIGVRVFDVDEHGRLRGVTHNDIWHPGENVSRCLAAKQMREVFDEAGYNTALATYQEESERWTKEWEKFHRQEKRFIDHYLPFTKSVEPPTWERPLEPYRQQFITMEEVPEPDHDREACQCGFWAYYTPSAQYDASGSRIYGVVEGYGEVTIGSKGFRAQKARILGVSLPDLLDGGVDHDAYRQSLVRRNYPDVPAFKSLPAMLAEIPTSREVDGPDTEGFWDQPNRHTDAATAAALWAQQFAALSKAMATGGPVHFSSGRRGRFS